jgi:hypothetical protein
LQESAYQAPVNLKQERLLAVAAVGEAAMGVALVANPSIVARLLFDTALTLGAIAMSRVAGISLLAVRWAGWPGIDASKSITTLLNYSLLVTVYLGYSGLISGLVGPLLWPAFALHVVLTVLLTHAWLNSARGRS